MRAGGRHDLRLLAGAVFLSSAGDLLAMVTLTLLVHERTGSGLAVAALFAAQLAPAIALAPVAGRMADRVEGTALLRVTALLATGAAAALAMADGLGPILALTALLAAAGAVSQPAEFALVPHVAAPERLAQANGIMEAARYAGFAAGPAAAGAIVALGGVQAALLVNAASFLAIAVAASLMRARRHPERVGGDTGRARDGVAPLRRDPVLRRVVGANVCALLFISACLTIEVFYVKDVLHAGNSAFAALTAVWMAAMVAGATGIAGRIPARAAAPAAVVALAVQGAGMAGQTLWVALPAAFAGYAVGGLGHGVKNTLIRLVIHDRVASHLHGRAFAAYGAARNAAELLALAAGGLLVTAIGARTGLLIAGAGPMILGLGALLSLRRCAPRSPGRSWRPSRSGRSRGSSASSAAIRSSR